MNADGAEQMFAPVKALRRTNATPFDADNDGRTDEDGPEDLNKDGFITLMRVKDPKGPYMVSPDDPRLMKRADPSKGESGGWAIYWEGLDKDRDGFVIGEGAVGRVGPEHPAHGWVISSGRTASSNCSVRASRVSAKSPSTWCAPAASGFAPRSPSSSSAPVAERA